MHPTLENTNINERKMKAWVINFSLNHAKRVYLLMAIVSLGLAAFIPTIQIDTDPENMLPDDQPDRVFHNQVKQEFALHDAIVVGMVNDESIYNTDSLSAIHQLSNKILTIDGVVKPDVMSLSMVDNIEQTGEGSIRFEYMMKNPPSSESEAAEIQQNVADLPLLLDTLVSGDGKAASIYVPIKDKNESYRISQAIQQHIDALNTDDQFHITGLPVAEDTFGYEMFVQMGISAPLAAAVIFLLLLFFFRNLTIVIAPMIIAMATVLSTMGLLIACGFKVHIMSSMIAIFLMPIAVVDSVHVMSEFADRFKPGADVKQVVKDVISHLFRPMLFTSITSTAGFASLALTPIPPVQIFGVFVGFGILLAFIWTILFMPAYISRMSEKQLKALQAKLHGDQQSLIARFIPKLGLFSTSWSKAIVIAFMTILAFSIVGIEKIQINDNPVRWFKQDHRIRIADRVLNDHFAGTYDAFLVLSHTKGTAYATELLQRLTDVTEQLENSSLKNKLTTLLSNTSEQTLNASEFIAVIDDALFNAETIDAALLEQAMSLLEQYQSEAQYFTQPETLQYMASLQQALNKSGVVGKSNSVVDLVKTVNRELFSGEQKDFVLPDSQAGVAQTLLQYQSSHRPQDLWHMVNPSYSRAVVWLQLTSGDNQDMLTVMDTVDAFTKQNPLPEGMSLKWAGKTYINVVWQDAMVSGMLDSLISAFIVVFIMMVILFRSIIFGLMAMLPLSLTITFIYGLIGWVGKDYDMPIAVLSALTLGLSVDFAIHFIDRTRSIYATTGDFYKTIQLMFEEPGRAITRNAIVIAIGFTPLLFAPLVPYITVGIFLATIMAVSALVTLLMLPAIFNLGKAKVFSKITGQSKQ
jgi:hypothetical protein